VNDEVKGFWKEKVVVEMKDHPGGKEEKHINLSQNG
jgi:hypothetical protein